MAKLTVIEYIPTEKEIEINIPYYYKHNYSNEYGKYIIYGCIDGKMTTSIREKSMGYEVAIEEWKGDSSYFTDGYKSTEVEYNKAKERLNKFCSKFIIIK
jgi:hypothetical protein